MFKYILIVIIEFLLLVGAICAFINPLLWIVVAFIVMSATIHLLSFAVGRKSNNEHLGKCMKLVNLYHIVVIIPAMLFVTARYIGVFFSNADLFCFLCTSLIFIIPISLQEFFKNIDEKGVFICPSEKNIIIEEGSIIAINYEIPERFKKEEKISLFATAFSLLKLVLLFLITIADYFDANIWYAKDIYAGIIFSIAYDAFYRPIMKQHRKRKKKIQIEEYKLDLQNRLNMQKKIIQDCHEQAKNEKLVVNKFLDLLSMYSGGLTLSKIQDIDRYTYIYLKHSCADFFNEYPYLSEDKITTTYLYEWSKDKSLSEVPMKKFGF